MHAQIITTTNGSQSRPSHGRFIPLAAAATAALLLSAPARSRAQQTLYVSSGIQTIDQVSATGTVSTFATLAANSSPEGLAFDASGNLYAADLAANQISQISPAGVVSTFATLPTPVDSGPVGLALGSGGNLYVGSTINSRVTKISPAGGVSAFASVNPGYTLNGLAFDAQGNLYAADGNSDQISRISPAGAVSLFATVPASTAQYPSGVQGLAFDTSGNLYVSDYDTSQIFRVTPAGTVSLFATLPANADPEGLAFDHNGNLYAADAGLNQISQISPDGLTVSTFATDISAPEYLAFGAVPEPSTWALLLCGGTIAVAIGNRRGCKSRT